MKPNILWLENKIEEFISVLVNCRDATTFEQERKLYEGSIEMAREWLNDLRTKSYQEVVDIILSPYTAKHFGDYWKHEPWGRLEMEALNSLQLAIKNKLGE